MEIVSFSLFYREINIIVILVPISPFKTQNWQRTYHMMEDLNRNRIICSVHFWPSDCISYSAWHFQLRDILYFHYLLRPQACRCSARSGGSVDGFTPNFRLKSLPALHCSVVMNLPVSISHNVVLLYR